MTRDLDFFGLEECLFRDVLGWHFDDEVRHFLGVGPHKRRRLFAAVRLKMQIDEGEPEMDKVTRPHHLDRGQAVFHCQIGRRFPIGPGLAFGAAMRSE